METKRPTLVILTPGFAKDEEDSTCLPMQQSFILTVKKIFPGLDIIILSFQYPYRSEKYSWHGLPVIPFNGQNKGGLKKLLLYRRVRSELHSIHQKKNIDAVLSFWYTECGITGKQFCDKYHIKHLCWIWGQDAKKQNKFPRKLRPTPGELVALSDFLQDEFERNHGVRPAYVIPPGIDDDSCISPRERDIDIMAAGSLIPLKQYDIFIEVIAAIKKQVPGIKVMLTGGGPEKNELEKLIRSLELESTITLTGELSHPDLLKQMQRTKVFLHTSSYEGFGIVCIEALQAGAHVISFTKPMKTEIPHWHIANNKEEMIRETILFLKDRSLDHQNSTPYRLDDSARRMMALLGL